MESRVQFIVTYGFSVLRRVLRPRFPRALCSCGKTYVRSFSIGGGRSWKAMRAEMCFMRGHRSRDTVGMGLGLGIVDRSLRKNCAGLCSGV